MDSRTAAWCVVAALWGLLSLGGAYAAGLARRHRWRGVLLTGLRAASLLALALLIRSAFFTRAPSPREETDPPHLAILVDGSDSMSLDAGGAPRSERARRVMEFARDEAKRRDMETSVYVFGGNLVTSGQEDRLDRRDSRLAFAVGQALARRRLDGLLVVSDGATSEPMVPPGLHDQARRTRTSVWTALPAPDGLPSFDLALDPLEVDPLNPRGAKATVRALDGPGRTTARVTFSISGRRGPARTLALSPSGETLFRLDDLEPGWHILSAEVEEAGGEITTRNNVARAAIQVAPGQRILVILGEPRLEDRRWVALLRRTHPDRTDVRSRTDPGLADLRLTDYAVVTVGDVLPGDLPLAVGEGLRDARRARVFTSARTLEAWRGAGIRGFPVARVGEEVRLLAVGPEAGRLVPGPGTLPPTLRFPVGSETRLGLLQETVAAPGARVVFEVEAGTRRIPAVLADRLENPTAIAVVPDTTWRWERHPNPEVRATHAAFWDGLLAWIVEGRFEEPDLRLTVTPASAADGSFIFTVEPGPADAPALDQASVRVEQGSQSREIRLSRVGASFTGSYRPPPEAEVLWIQATGQRTGVGLTGERRPWVPGTQSREFADPRLRPDRLAELAGHPDRMISWDGHEAGLRSMLNELARDPFRIQQRTRSAGQEAMLAMLFFLLSGVEWLLEKRLRDAQGA